MTGNRALTLNVFYEEPDPDRWLPLDRLPRRLVRRLVRGRQQPGGPQRVFLNLVAGLECLGAGYRLNDYKHARAHPHEIACIIGKPHVLDSVRWNNPIIFGAATFSHPLEQPRFFERYPTVRKILVPGEWMRQMWEPYYGERVVAWPVGIDTERWTPGLPKQKKYDFLLYDKVRWKHDAFETALVDPIREELRRRELSFVELRYGRYREEQYRELLNMCRAMIFLCEHETQGIAYQQALSAGVAILAWDRGGYWQDPSFYPEKVSFSPVSSVPYWDERCGVKFTAIEDFAIQLESFMTRLREGGFAPRDFICENLTLVQCAQRYLEVWQDVESQL